MIPLRLLNTRGIPAIESVSSVSDSGTLTISFNSHPYVQGRFAGGFWVKIGQTVTSGGDNVMFSTIGVPNSTYPLYLQDGTQATSDNLVSDGTAVHLCFFDSDNSKLILIA